MYEKEQCTLPQSLTKLFELFILNAVKRHASIVCKDPQIIRKQHTLAKLREPLQKQINILSMVAYNGLVADKMVFSYEDLEEAFPDCNTPDLDVNLLSLMTVFKGFTSTGEELSYQFLHLTIQEYLAARWAASHLSADELLTFFRDHLNTERFRTMLLFLAGISRLEFPYSQNLFQHQLDLIHPANRHYANKKTCDSFFFLAHLIYESGNHILCHGLASALQGGKLSAAGYSMSPFDCLVLAHFLAWSDCSLELLDLQYCSLTHHCLEIMHKVCSEHCGTAVIKEVVLSRNHLQLKSMQLISRIPVFEHTRKLTLHGLLSPEGGSPDHIEVHCPPHLTRLDISLKAIHKVCSHLLETAFRSKNLQVLRFQNGSIPGQNVVNLFSSLEHNTSLEEFDLSLSIQLAEGDSEAVGCAIERLLRVNTRLKVLNLRYCRLDTAVVTDVAAGLEHNTSLEELNLSGNRRIVVGNNKAVGYAIERMLRVNKSLQLLDLSDCKLDTAVATHIAAGLEHSSLAELNIARNSSITSEGGIHIFKHLHNNLSLKKLNISYCGLEDSSSAALVEMLSCNKSLIELTIGYCGIPEAGLTELAKGLLQNTSLQTLGIDEYANTKPPCRKNIP